MTGATRPSSMPLRAREENASLRLRQLWMLLPCMRQRLRRDTAMLYASLLVLAAAAMMRCGES